MADKKITQLDAVTTVANTDLLLIVRDPSTTPVNKKLEVGDLLGESAQTVITQFDLRSTGASKLTGNTMILKANSAIVLEGGADVNADRLRIRTAIATPANSNNSFYGWNVGTFAWDSNYLYIAISASQIARFAANTSW